MAVLMANWNRGLSYLDNFLPFVAECFRTADGRPMSLAQVQDALVHNFAVTVPQHALQTVLNRAARKGLVIKREHEFVPYPRKLARWGLPASPTELPRCVAALVEALVRFADDRYSQTLTPEVAEAALDEYVASYAPNIALMSRFTEKTLAAKPAPSGDLEKLVGAFVAHVVTADPTCFGYLESLVQANMLASALYLPDPGQVERKFRETTLYLDTPFLLELLDCKGQELVAPARELVELAKKNGARVACFERTLSELGGVILGAGSSSSADWRAYNDVAAYLAEKGYRRADFELKAGQLSQELASLGIRVLSSPPYEKSLVIDEVALAAELDALVHYRREGTREHDVTALAAIYRLRRGSAPPILEESRAIFVTNNDKVVIGAKAFFKNGGESAWPPAILDADLATLLWVKRPSAAPDLPRKRILADCYAALRPSVSLWNMCIDQIDRLAKQGEVSENDVELMRFSPEARRTFMALTLGNPEAATSQAAAEALDAARRAAQEPIIIELREEQSRREEAERQAHNARCEAADELHTRPSVVKAAVQAALRQSDERRWSRIRARADRHAHRAAVCVNIVLVGVIVLIGLTELLSIVGPNIQLRPLLSWALRMLGGLSVVVYVASVGWNWHVKGFVKRFESWYRPRVERRYFRRAGEGAECEEYLGTNAG